MIANINTQFLGMPPRMNHAAMPPQRSESGGGSGYNHHGGMMRLEGPREEFGVRGPRPDNPLVQTESSSGDLKRMGDRLQHLDDRIARLNSRIESASAEGVDTAKFENKLLELQDKKERVGARLEGFNSTAGIDYGPSSPIQSMFMSFLNGLQGSGTSVSTG